MAIELVDPRAKPLFQVRVLGGDERARLTELRTEARELYVATPPAKRSQGKQASRKRRQKDAVSLEAGPPPEDPAKQAWAELVDSAHVYLVELPEHGRAQGVDGLRAALLTQALPGIDVSIERARLAKRPYATSIIAGAALVTAAEGLLPGAAAFVLTTQIGAITSLYYLYTGRWIGRTQVFTLIPVFASEAAGGSAFLLVKSFLPPTGVADVVAAGIACTMTIAMLGSVTWALEHGYELDQQQQLRLAFKRLNAKTRAERSEIVRNRARWGDKQFWNDLVRRVIFD